MTQVNRLVDLVPPPQLRQSGLNVGHVEALVLAPSKDLATLALQFADRLPNAVRALLRALGSTQGTGGNLTSYLLFDRDFCRALIDMGYTDTMARRAEVADFLAGAPNGSLLRPDDYL